MTLSDRIFAAVVWFMAGFGFMLSLNGIIEELVGVWFFGAATSLIFVVLGVHKILKE